jgi:hypothetical protein
MTAHFDIRPLPLPHKGIIPGAAGHKKVEIPKGTMVYCIMHGPKYFWAVYLHKAEAEEVAETLEATITGRAKRSFDLPTMLAWNFKIAFPERVSRPKRSTEQPKRVGDN